MPSDEIRPTQVITLSWPSGNPSEGSKVHQSTSCHFNFKQLEFRSRTTKAQVLWSFEQAAGQVIRVLGKKTWQADSKVPHRDTKTTRGKHKYTVRDSRMQRDRNLKC